MHVIETSNLSFAFRKGAPVVKNINLQVEKGSIYGFLGPNGAGKTTTIRLILGLLPQENSIRLFGKNFNPRSQDVFSRIGALIETPSMYGHLSGFDNLEITRRLQNASKSRIGEVLELVGLKGAANKKAKQYSLGMKQRLGLAMALLSNPEVLILDEPTNGLDPNGMIETRELLLRLNKESGTTIFLSSHLLSEIEKIATHVGIINRGELVFQGKTADLLSMKQHGSKIRIETNSNEKAFALLKDLYAVQRENHHLAIAFKERKDIAAINRLLVQNDLDVYSLNEENADLENIFLHVTGN
jgi:lantibiotic transport system ATP-binding protein